ncbi:MAG: hypothetical protein KF862_13195 [Chitinophagaceae bacterium]|nr:hypothetical protein [Chitinophagaceae bacterium]
MLKCNVVLPMLFFCATLFAQKKKATDPAAGLKEEAIRDIQSKADLYRKNAMDLWDFAEVGYKEVKSSVLQKRKRNLKMPKEITDTKRCWATDRLH